MRNRQRMKSDRLDGVSETAFRRFCGTQRVAFAALFGSAAQGRATGQSDVDLAFWMQRTPTPSCELDLINALTPLFHRNDVDVVVLNHANPLLQWQVASTGTLLYERRAGAFRLFQLAAMKRYDDSRRLLALQDRFLDRLVKGVRPAWQTISR